MTIEQHPPRRIWSWIILAVVVIIAVVAAVIFAVTASRGDATAAPTASATVSAATPSGTNTTDAAPTGCLGGPNRDAAMVLAAQKAAPHISNGAVEFAAAFVRWAYQYPYPSSSDATEVSRVAVAPNAPTKDLAAFFATKPNVTGGLVPDDTEYYRTTVPGVWYLDSYSNATADVSIGTGVVIKGALNPTVRGSITVTVAWSTNGWQFVTSAGKRTTEQLYDVGTAFSGGC